MSIIEGFIMSVKKVVLVLSILLLVQGAYAYEASDDNTSNDNNKTRG